MTLDLLVKGSPQNEKFWIEEASRLPKALFNPVTLRGLPGKALSHYQEVISRASMVYLEGEDLFEGQWMTPLVMSIRDKKSVVILGIDSNSKRNKSAASAVAALSHLISLARLCIIGAFCNLPAATSFKMTLSSPEATIIDLALIDCNIGTQEVASIANGLLSNRSVRILRLAENSLGNEGLRALAPLLQASTTLEELYLDSVFLDSDNLPLDEGADALAAALIKNPLSNVCLLSLADNRMAGLKNESFYT
jgi:hypothetical protein